MLNCPICDCIPRLSNVSNNKEWQVICGTCGVRGPRCVNQQEAQDHWHNLADACSAHVKVRRVRCEECKFYTLTKKHGHMCEEPESLEFPVIGKTRICPFFKKRVKS